MKEHTQARRGIGMVAGVISSWLSRPSRCVLQQAQDEEDAAAAAFAAQAINPTTKLSLSPAL